MRILALDLATRTGWAVWNGERRESGFIDFDVKRGESPGMRYVRFNAWLTEMLAASVTGLGRYDIRNSERPDLVVYEQPFVMRSGAAAEISLGLATRVQEACAKRGIEHSSINGSTLKKWVTGKGNAKKPVMVRAVADRFCPGEFEADYNALDDNEADAIALLEYARAELVPAEAR